eukprot:GHVR01152900.1.p1 GENE.GHVR01152900.1~~GHVR01152900.1.p1  ORF type:complete len:152 (-),score=34.71 GHVR01152900.1:59-514(-)
MSEKPSMKNKKEEVITEPVKRKIVEEEEIRKLERPVDLHREPELRHPVFERKPQKSEAEKRHEMKSFEDEQVESTDETVDKPEIETVKSTEESVSEQPIIKTKKEEVTEPVKRMIVEEEEIRKPERPDDFHSDKQVEKKKKKKKKQKSLNQ